MLNYIKYSNPFASNHKVEQMHELAKFSHLAISFPLQFTFANLIFFPYLSWWIFICFSRLQKISTGYSVAQ